MTNLASTSLSSELNDRNPSQFSARVAILSRLFVCLLILTLLPNISFAQDAEKLGSIIISGEVNVYQQFGAKPLETGIEGVTAHLTPAGIARNTEIRYKLWTLAGEPVWTFAAKFPEVQSITLKRGDKDLFHISRNTFLPSGTVKWQGDNTVVVSPDVMALARIYEFGMYLLLNERALKVLPQTFRSTSGNDSKSISGYPAIYRPFPGILGPANEWSWDVPGSPEWNNVFRSPEYGISPTFSDSSYLQNAYDAETNKSIMRRLLYANGFKNIDVISIARVGDLKVTLNELLSAIRKQHPTALDVVYGVKTDEERALAKIISGFENDFERNGFSYQLSEEANEIDELIQDFRQELSPELSKLWKSVMQRVEKPEINDSSNEIIKEAAAVFQRSSDSSKSELDSELLASIRTSSDAVAALPTSGNVWKSLRNNEIKRSLKLLSMQGSDGNSNLKPFCTLKRIMMPMGPMDECDKWGYKDHAGNVVIEPQFDNALQFHHGYAVVINYFRKNYLIDVTGKFVFDSPFDGMANLGEFGLLAVQKDQRKRVWSYIDLNGTTVMDTDYIEANPFIDGYARVKSNTELDTMYINREFEVLKGLSFYDGQDFSQGLAVVQTKHKYREGVEEYRFLKTDGSLMGSFASAESFHESGFAVVATKKDRYLAYGIIDTRGKVIIPLDYQQVSIDFSPAGELEFEVVVDRVNGKELVQRFNAQGKALGNN